MMSGIGGFSNFARNFHANIKHDAKIQNTNKSEISSSTPPVPSFNEVLGYKVDEDGYFTSEFNEAAGIPKDYKIHSDTLKSLVNVNDKAGVFYKMFSKIDIAKTVGNAYKILSQVAGDELLNSKESFTKEDLAKFPQGYEYEKSSLKVTKVNKNIYDYASARSAFDDKSGKTYMETLFFNSSYHAFTTTPQYKPSTNIFDNNNGGKEGENVGVFINPHGERYTNPDGSITKGGLIAAVINSNLHVREGETTVWGKMQGYDKSISGKEYRQKLDAFIDSRNIHGIKGSELDGLSKDYREYVLTSQKIQESLLPGSTALSGNSNVTSDGKESKSLFEIMQEDMKEAQKRLEKLIEQKKRTQKMLGKNRKYDKELEQNARKNLEELEAMMKFNAKSVDIKA
ncbi:Cj0814 family flagellar-dependent secreted protein [Campylobacter concisus]